MRLWMASGFGLALLFASPAALADADKATALYNTGFADMQAHRFDTGCPSLDASYREDPHPGGLITLAECDYLWGKLTLARDQYAAFLDLVAHLPQADAAKQAERVTLATSRKAELDRDVPTVTLTAADGAPPGSTLTLDDDAPTPPGTPRRTDPGPHTAHLRFPDGRVATLRLTVGKAENRTFVVILEGPAQPLEAPSAAPSSSRTPLFYAAVGVGAVGLVTGAILGGLALADKSTIDAHCKAGACDSSSAVSTANAAVSLGWGSTAAFAVGVAGAGGAVALWVLRPPRADVAIYPVIVPPSPASRSYGTLGARIEF